MQQAAEMEFPVRRAWMALQCHMMPRMLRTCASLSDGCSHAATFLIALTASAVNKMELTGVIPRGLADNISTQWVGRDLGKMT
eukprot:216798-Pyramimonas_sp.AAC.1